MILSMSSRLGIGDLLLGCPHRSFRLSAGAEGLAADDAPASEPVDVGHVVLERNRARAGRHVQARRRDENAVGNYLHGRVAQVPRGNVMVDLLIEAAEAVMSAI